VSTRLPTNSPDRRVSYLTWRITTEINLVFLILAIVALVGDVVIWSLSFASPDIVMPDWIFAPFFAFAIVNGFVAIVDRQLVRGWKNGRMPVSADRFKELPNVVKVTFVVLAIAALWSGPVSLFIGVPGQPGYDPQTRQYFFNDHGVVTLTNRAHYLAASALQTRGFISISLLVTVLTVVVMDGERRFRRNVRLAHVPATNDSAPWFIKRTWPAIIATLLGLVVVSIGVYGIVTQVDSYLGKIQLVRMAQTTETLASGPHVIFVWCESVGIEPKYDCPALVPRDVIITATFDGAIIETSPDPSADHLSPRDLPAVGRLVFDVPKSGEFSLQLTRPITNGVFVAKSPGSVARSVVPDGAVTVLGGLILALALVLISKRMRRISAQAPPVSVPGN